jgi:hypothetical protein
VKDPGSLGSRPTSISAPAKRNCSICFKTRAWMAFIAATRFACARGGESLREYQFGRKGIHYKFCTQSWGPVVKRSSYQPSPIRTARVQACTRMDLWINCSREALRGAAAAFIHKDGVTISCGPSIGSR